MDVARSSADIDVDTPSPTASHSKTTDTSLTTTVRAPKSLSMSPQQTEETRKPPVSTVRHRGTLPIECSLVGEKSWCITLPGRFVTSDMIGCGPATEKRKERVVKKSVVAECLMVRQVLPSDCPTADTLRCLACGPLSGCPLLYGPGIIKWNLKTQSVEFNPL